MQVFAGTVLTNWHERDPASGLRLGHALLGRIRITCVEVEPLATDSALASPSPEAPAGTQHAGSNMQGGYSPGRSSCSGGGSGDHLPGQQPWLPVSLRALLRVEVPEREWQISPQGLPIRCG